MENQAVQKNTKNQAAQQNMENQVIQLSREEADRFANGYFISICGFQNREGDKYRRLLDRGMKVKEKIVDKIDLKAVVSAYDGDVISGNTARIGGEIFVCNAFQQLNRESIRKIYTYIFTAGSFELDDGEPVIDQLYSDIWWTAYTDAGLEILKQRVKEDFDRRNGGERAGVDGRTESSAMEDKAETRTAMVLDPFGPGFYGMDVDQVGKFFHVLDGGKIGVRARTNSLMLPLKSCAGFFVVADDGAKLPSADCKSCHADHRGCEYCHAVIREAQAT